MIVQNIQRYLSSLMIFGGYACFLISCVADKPNSSSSTTSSVVSSSVSSSQSSSAVSAPSFETAVIVPDASWACGVPDGIPPPASGNLVFTASLQISATHEFGVTPYGDRRLLDVSGGTFSGSNIQGEFLTGGLELELALSNGATELEQIDILRTSDGTHIYMRSCGFAGAGAKEVRFIPDFEAPNSSRYSWLNSGKYAGVRTTNEAKGTVELAIYDISNVVANQPKIRLKDPEGVPNQPWVCSTLTGSQGASLLTENVTLGGSISIGQTKRGSRNIIPITGGSFSGKLSGTVLPGGADYQFTAGQGGTVLDARYTLKTNDGEYILIRNCGGFGALVPQFETRRDGPYAFLNTTKYVSSNPGVGGGGVTITFYERR